MSTTEASRFFVGAACDLYALCFFMGTKKGGQHAGAREIVKLSFGTIYRLDALIGFDFLATKCRQRRDQKRSQKADTADGLLFAFHCAGEKKGHKSQSRGPTTSDFVLIARGSAAKKEI